MHGAFAAVEAAAVPIEADGALPERVSPRRRQEFAAGRVAARRALNGLGRSAGALMRGPNGAATWPAGTTGSITHSREWAAAVVTTVGAIRAVGIDLERVARVDRRIARRVLTPGEFDRLPGCAAGIAFSAKEAVYKAVNPRTDRYRGFQEAEIDFVNDGSFVARQVAGDPVHAIIAQGVGRTARLGALVLGVFWIPG
jgi:4'-phosphopantetheinyl transferase EntD